jgi:hypothetical protein
MSRRARDLAAAMAVGGTIFFGGLAVHKAQDAGALPHTPQLGPFVSQLLGTSVSPANFSAALDAQAQLTEDFINTPGVVGTAVGTDFFGNAVVKVYLEQPGAQFLPHSFAGIDVVPEVIGKIYALGEGPQSEANTRSDGDQQVNPKSRFNRPVPIGVSSGQGDVTAGTIGARVTDGNEVYALSNNHVFANRNLANKGDNILQPGVADGGSGNDSFGTLYDYEEIRFCRGALCSDNRIDAAIALTSADNLGTETPSNGYGAPRTRTTTAKLNQQVQKYGRTTGHTQGKVTGINATVNVNYRTGVARFVGQIMIVGNSQMFSTGGDSGSLIVSKGLGFGDRLPVGLLFAGSASNTIANPIDLVLDRFNVKVEGN